MSHQIPTQRRLPRALSHYLLLSVFLLSKCQGLQVGPLPSTLAGRRAAGKSSFRLDMAAESKERQPKEVVFRMESSSPEELPDDVPRDVSKEVIEETMNKSQKTLYDILESLPTSTRPELKKKYVELAKRSHPDAMIANSQNRRSDADRSQQGLDFGEIAAAWRVLGDSKSRKRYDRDLAAKAFSERAQRYANQKLEEAVPAVASLMDNFAVPLLRRTTATTWAVGKAVAQGVDNFSKTTSRKNNPQALSDAFLNAIQAGQQAGRQIDSLELREKSQELEERAQAEKKVGMQIEQELAPVTEKRLLGTLQSEEFALSSEEAKMVLERLDIDDTVTLMDRAMLRSSIEEEIEALEFAEQSFSEKLQDYESTDQDWNNALNEQASAKQALGERKQKEIEARRALEEAQRLVAEAKAYLVSTSNVLRGVEKRVRQNASDMDRVTSALSKKQERVRNSLRKKADLMSVGIQPDYITEEELTALRRREIQLMGESQQVARMVVRLQSRSEKLKSRAEALDLWQKNGQRKGGANGTSPPPMNGLRG